MLTYPNIILLLTIYFFSFSVLMVHLVKTVYNQGLSFHFFFTLLYIITFFLGVPLSLLLNTGFNVRLMSMDVLVITISVSFIFYMVYYLSYRIKLTSSETLNHPTSYQVIASTHSKSAVAKAHFFGIIFILIGAGSAVLFYLSNGFLLFQLSNYSEIFAPTVHFSFLKRFFYFFIIGLLVFYFAKPTYFRWIAFLILGLSFGIFTYLVVGGTRANIALAAALFFLLGMEKARISLIQIVGFGLLGILGMFVLALKRYNLNIQGMEVFYTFLYLSRDTFSPWENLALIFNHYERINFQGLMPIIRDFYVFIPKSMWESRPDLILNTANYFTWDILNYHANLAISPTLLGSFIIMGGIPMLVIGSVVCGLMIKLFDTLYFYAKTGLNFHYSVAFKTYCFGNCFNLIVLVREGFDAFLSRFMFFSLVFFGAIIITKLLFLFINQFKVSQYTEIKD